MNAKSSAIAMKTLNFLNRRVIVGLPLWGLLLFSMQDCDNVPVLAGLDSVVVYGSSASGLELDAQNLVPGITYNLYLRSFTHDGIRSAPSETLLLHKDMAGRVFIRKVRP